MDIRKLNDFYFSQNSLNTFKQCFLKFNYKYIEGINFRKDEEGYYENIETGLNFHLLCNRYFIGIDPFIGKDTKDKDNLNKWYNNLIETIPMKEDNEYLSEYTIKMQKNTIKLQANYDLIILKKDSIEIWDFKTENRKPKVEDLKKRMQTKVYMYVLMENLNLINKEINYDKLKMVYFNPQFENSKVEITYSLEEHTFNEESIKAIIDSINEYEFKGNYFEGLKKKACNYCEFYRLCESKGYF